jgi:hypothetical protein
LTPRLPRVLASLALGAALAASAILPAAAQEARNFTVWNKTEIPFAQLFVSPTTTTDWGDDYLGNQVLNPGDGWKMTFTKFAGGQCLYDVKVIGKAGEEGKLVGVDLCKVDTITFSPKIPSPREELETWLKNTTQLTNIGIDPSNATADWASDDGGTTLTIKPKDPAAKYGIVVAVAQLNTVENAKLAIAASADKRKADGWNVDTTAPQGLGDRGFITAAKVDSGVATLTYVIQIYDRVAVVSVAAGDDKQDQIVAAGSGLLVDLLKALDPTFKG